MSLSRKVGVVVFVLLTFSAVGGGVWSIESWVNVGPTSILPGQGTGRVVDIAVDPLDANRWLIAAPGGGVWETLNAGGSWTSLTDGEEVQAIGAVAFAPGNQNVIYAGTGEGISFSNSGGRGVLKSVDGGATWQLLGRPSFERAGISDLLVDPGNQDVVITGSRFVNSGRVTQSNSPQPVVGIYRSADGGASWTRVLPGEVMDLESRPGDFSRQYAAIGIRQQPAATVAEKGIWRSFDGGSTWSKLTGPWSGFGDQAIGRGEIAVSPSSPDTAYVSIAGQGAFFGTLLGFWRTDNAWDPAPSWTQISVIQYCGSTCYNSQDLLVHPTDPARVYAAGEGGVYQITPNPSQRLFGSGAQHTLALAGTRLIAGGDAGVFSADPPSFVATNRNGNLSITQFYKGSIHPGAGSLMLGGTDLLGSVKRTGTTTWTQVLDWYGSDNAISPSSPDTHLIVSYPGQTIYRSLNGVTFTLASSGIPGSIVGGIIEHLEMCPSNENVVIADSQRTLWRSNNFFSASGQPTWTQNSPQWPGFQNAQVFASSDPTCSTYAISSSHLLEITTNGGATWTDLDPTNTVVDRTVTDLVFDPRDANVMYVSLEGFNAILGPGHVFKTTNALSGSPIWTNVSPPDDAPFNALALAPGDPDTLYAGGDFGLWKSPDGGATWSRVTSADGLPTGARIFDLDSPPSGRLAAFTHGRGAYVLAAEGECPGGSEADLDLDGVGNSCDNCPSVPNANQADTDGDGIGDACDLCASDPPNDADGDGVGNSCDNCPSLPNANQADSDGDGLGDACDVCASDPPNDADGDGVGNSCDNCPSTPNASQADSDNDGLGNACDVCASDPLNDADGDGLCAGVDACPSVAPALGLDADHNGCTDTIAGLAAIIDGLNLSNQIENGLLAKLTEAQKALDKGNEGPAINALNDFINQVNAKRGNGIAPADADLLILYAQNLIQLIQA